MTDNLVAVQTGLHVPYLHLWTSFVWICVLFAVCNHCFVIVDKSPLMNDFISQIKVNPELTGMFESIQRDTTMTTSETSLMDIS